jgi:predicted dehydrogenase
LKLKVAIVGCGKIADAHVEEVQKIDTAEVTAVCDLERLMAEQLAVRYGVPAYFDDYATMLAGAKPDVVHITTPPQSHLSLSKQAIDAGAHVYIEKPFTVDHAEAVELVEYAHRAGRKVVVGHSYEFDPLSDALRKLVDDGVLGEAVHVESMMGYNLSGPYGAALLGDSDHWIHRLPGKLFQNNINHLMHKIAWFLPDDKPVISAVGARRRDAVFGDARDDMLDEMRVIMAGRKTTAYATFSSHAQPLKHCARVYGTENTITLDYAVRTLTIDQGEKLPSAIGRLLPTFAQSRQYMRAGFKNVFRFMKADYQFFAGMKALFEKFYDSIIEDTDPPIAYDEILRVTAWMDEIYAQLGQDGRGGEGR